MQGTRKEHLVLVWMDDHEKAHVQHMRAGYNGWKVWDNFPTIEKFSLAQPTCDNPALDFFETILHTVDLRPEQVLVPVRHRVSGLAQSPSKDPLHQAYNLLALKAAISGQEESFEERFESVEMEEVEGGVAPVAAGPSVAQNVKKQKVGKGWLLVDPKEAGDEAGKPNGAEGPSVASSLS